MVTTRDVIQVASGIPMLLAIVSLLGIRSVPIGSIIGFFLFFGIAWAMVYYTGLPKSWEKLIGMWAFGGYGFLYLFLAIALLISGVFDPLVQLTLLFVFGIPAAMGYLLFHHFPIRKGRVLP